MISINQKAIIISTMDNEMDELTTLPFEKLFQIAQQRFNQFLYDDAEIYYQLAYHKKPYNEMIVLCYAHVLKLNEKEDEAQKILIKSIQENPNGTYKRYFELAELYEQERSIQLFSQGIKAAQKCLQNPFLTTAPHQEIKRDIAQAAASIAGIYLHDMDIDFSIVEEKCKFILEKGKKIDPTCMDLRLQISNYFYEIDKEELATEELVLFKNNILQEKQDYQDELVIQCAKQFLDLSSPKFSLEVLEKIYENQSDNPEILYYMAGCNFELEQYKQCKDLIRMYMKLGSQDQQFNEGINTLKGKLDVKLKKQMDETEEGMNNEGESESESDQWQDVDELDD